MPAPLASGSNSPPTPGGSVETDRPAALPDLELTVTPPPGPVDADTVDRYRQLGVARLVMLPRAGDVESIVQLVTETAETHLG